MYLTRSLFGGGGGGKCCLIVIRSHQLHNSDLQSLINSCSCKQNEESKITNRVSKIRVSEICTGVIFVSFPWCLKMWKVSQNSLFVKWVSFCTFIFKEGNNEIFQKKIIWPLSPKVNHTMRDHLIRDCCIMSYSDHNQPSQSTSAPWGSYEFPRDN